MKQSKLKIYLLLAVVMCVFFIACTDHNKTAMEEYLKGIELINKADRENEHQEKLRLLAESAEIFRQVAKQYPQSGATERILEVATSPYNLYFINNKIKELEASNPPVVENNELATDTNILMLNRLPAKLKEWLQTNNLSLFTLNDYGEYPPIAETIRGHYSAINIGEDQYSKYVGGGCDLAERLLFFNEHQYDISMLRTPESWAHKGIVVQTKSATGTPELWFFDEKSLEVTNIKANNENRAGIMSYHSTKDRPETIRLQIYFEACNPYYYIGEVRSDIVQVMQNSISDSDQQFAYFDDDYKILAQDDNWTTYQRILPKQVFSWSDGKPLIYHEPTSEFEKTGYCWGDNVNVREQGGEHYKSHKVLFQLNKGAQVIILQKLDNWYEIQDPQDPARVGWIINDYLKHIPPLEIADAEKNKRLIQLKEQAQKLFVELGKLQNEAHDFAVMANSKELVDKFAGLIKLLYAEFTKNILPIAILDLYDCDLAIIVGKEKVLAKYHEAISGMRNECSKKSDQLRSNLQAKAAYEKSSRLESQVFSDVNSLYFETMQVINAKLVHAERRNLIDKAEAINQNIYSIRNADRRCEVEKFLHEYKRIMGESYEYSLDRISDISTAYNRLNYYLQGN